MVRENKALAISTSNEELDNRLGGGIPIPSLILIEGDHGTGKSVLAQQITYGALKNNMNVYYLTTENTVKDFLLQTKRLSIDMTSFFFKGKLKIFPVHIEGAKWAKRVAKYLLDIVGEFMLRTIDYWDLMVIDSFSVLAVYASINDVLDFISRAKNITSRGKVIVFVVHPEALTDDIMIRLRSECDGYIRLKPYSVGGMIIKVMEIVKLRGALGPVDSMIAFDVDPAFGIKIIPISLAKA
ncbi:MAG: ATPase domain-containing protein [Ignisphaera sp.]